MKETNCCAYCGKEFNGSSKPFIPVRSTVPYHWKCYIKKIKDRSEEVVTVTEIDEGIYEEIQQSL